MNACIICGSLTKILRKGRCSKCAEYWRRNRCERPSNYIREIPPEVRFWQKVKCSPSGCWEWIAKKTKYGYGIFAPVGRDPKIPVHRFAYELLIGSIPKDMILHHQCNNRICVNPWHCQPLAVHQHVLVGNSPAAKNSRKTHCPKGYPYNVIRLQPNGIVLHRGCSICSATRSRENYRRKHSVKCDAFRRYEDPCALGYE